MTFSTGARADPGVEPGRRASASASASREEEARILGASVSFLRAKAYDTGVFEPEDSAALLAVLEAGSARADPAAVAATIPTRRTGSAG